MMEIIHKAFCFQYLKAYQHNDFPCSVFYKRILPADIRVPPIYQEAGTIIMEKQELGQRTFLWIKEHNVFKTPMLLNFDTPFELLQAIQDYVNHNEPLNDETIPAQDFHFANCEVLLRGAYGQKLWEYVADGLMPYKNG
jgi:hypothetical protein